MKSGSKAFNKVKVKDKFSRTIDYLRISITDRCNMRCNYCMPNGFINASINELLTYNEIIDVAKAAAACGISKLKITGGEPLIRAGVVDLIRELKSLPGIEQVTMTTNGVFLAEMINDLKAAGLDAVNISLDSLNPERFRVITGFDLLHKVKEGINAALSSGIPTKINTVLQRGLNDDEWDDLIQLAKNNPVYVRFIELMPIGEGKNFQAVDNNEILKAISSKYEVEQDTLTHGNGPATYIRIPGFIGGVGFISALCGKFCNSCNRLRLTSHGKLKPCLCFADSINIREATNLEQAIKDAINMKPQGHCFDERGKISETRKMFEIGG